MSTGFAEPPADFSSDDRLTFERGWRALVDGDLERAARDLERLDRRHQTSPAVASALGYLDLRLGNPAAAERKFSAALKRAPSLASAQAGWVLTALSRQQEELAFDRLRLLREEHPDHVLVEQYLLPLQLKLAETKLQAARALRREERYGEAAERYREALEIAPEAAGLYAEAAEVELASGNAEAAASHAERALELEPRNAHIYRLRGDALRSMGQLGPAVDAYRRAADLRPDDTSLAALLADAQRELDRESLPQEYLRIDGARRLTREQLAALLSVKLRPLFEGLRRRTNVIATDIGDSWASEFIREVVSAGILDVFPNHTFQPRAYVRRDELAGALVSALDALAPERRKDATPDVAIEDVAPENLNYRAVALAISLGLLPTDQSGRFEPLRFVTGGEAVEAVDALAERIVP